MQVSEFDDGFEDDPSAREHAEQMLGEAIMGAPIRALDPRPAVSVPESTPIREAVRLMLDRQIGAVLVARNGREPRCQREGPLQPVGGRVSAALRVDAPTRCNAP